MARLVRDYTIIIVTHNMQQAGRVAGWTGFLTAIPDPDTGDRAGELIEFGRTGTIFTSPWEKATEDYISGRFD